MVGIIGNSDSRYLVNHFSLSVDIDDPPFTSSLEASKLWDNSLSRGHLALPILPSGVSWFRFAVEGESPLFSVQRSG